MFVVITWKYFGFHMILMLAGLQGIPRELEEAAAIDGASRSQTVRRIILPLLGPTIRVSVFLSIIGAMQLFDLVWATTRGGPFHASDTMAVYLVDYGIKRTQMGYGSAIAVILFLMCARGRPCLPAFRHAPRHGRRRDAGRRLSRCRRAPQVDGDDRWSAAACHACRSAPSWASALRWVVLLAVAVAIVVPIAYAFLGGFRTTGADPQRSGRRCPIPGSSSTTPRSLTGGDVLAAAVSTASSSQRMTVVIVVTVSALAAYVFARFEFRGREALFTLFALGLLFPAAVAILPLYILLRTIGLLDNPLGVALPLAAFGIPLTIIILRPFFKSIPAELEDAAAIDGCSRFGFFWRILLPLSRPALATVGHPRPGGQLELVPAAAAHPGRTGAVDRCPSASSTSRPSTHRTWPPSSPTPRCRWSRRSSSTCSPSGSSSAA